MTETRKMPPLGGGSIDFNAVHEADARGKPLQEAIDSARTRPEPPGDLPALSGKTKAELLEIAEDRGVDADDSMTNAEITEALTGPADGE